MNNRIKYNLDVFTEAAENLDINKNDLRHVCTELDRVSLQGENSSIPCPERILFQSVYEVGGNNQPYVFECCYGRAGFELPSISERQKDRILAILFVREIARLKNRQGSHDARSKRRAEARAKKELEKVAAVEFAKVKSSGENPAVDLRGCKPGDKLLTKHGMILTYVGLQSDPTYPHEVEYPMGGNGSRTNDGFAFAKIRLASDQDVIKVLGQ
jgi:hypothetical protein